MADVDHNDPRGAFQKALSDRDVLAAAQALRASKNDASLTEILELGRALAHACGDGAEAAQLHAEIAGYQDAEVEVPPERRALGFASPFRVRALDMGLMDPEEIFLANREKFSQVTLTIHQPIAELQAALAQIQDGGVLHIPVPASEITGESADTDEDTEVYIYILPREIQRIVDVARARALRAIVARIVDVVIGEPDTSEVLPPSTPEQSS